MKIKFLIPIIIFALILIFFCILKQLNLFQSIFVKKGEGALGLTNVIDIPLSGGANRLDYQSIDVAANRLYISHLGSDLIHVYGLKQQKVTKDIRLNSSPLGVLAVPSLKE